MHTVTISRIFQPAEFHQSAKRLSQSFVFLQKSQEKHHSKIPVNFLIRQKREHPCQLASGFSNISQFVQPTVHINESELFCNIIPVILQLFFQIIPITKIVGPRFSKKLQCQRMLKNLFFQQTTQPVFFLSGKYFVVIVTKNQT